MVHEMHGRIHITYTVICIIPQSLFFLVCFFFSFMHVLVATVIVVIIKNAFSPQDADESAEYVSPQRLLKSLKGYCTKLVRATISKESYTHMRQYI